MFETSWVWRYNYKLRFNKLALCGQAFHVERLACTALGGALVPLTRELHKYVRVQQGAAATWVTGSLGLCATVVGPPFVAVSAVSS